MKKEYVDRSVCVIQYSHAHAQKPTHMYTQSYTHAINQSVKCVHVSVRVCSQYLFIAVPHFSHVNEEQRHLFYHEHSRYGLYCRHLRQTVEATIS